MAITKLWSIKTHLKTSLEYIANPDKATVQPDIDVVEGVIKYIENTDKTENCLYVKAFNCSKDKAYKTMVDTQNLWGKSRRKNRTVAYHLVQSFKSFETTPDIAYRCGEELVKRLFADKYECVLATHVNKDHLHNHIIINSVSFKDGTKYRRSFNDYFRDIRGISDEICREYCLSVIENPKSKGMHYAEWKAMKEGKPTIRGQIRAELDEIIKLSYTYKDFWKNLEKRGYVIHRKGENIKYTSIIAPFGKRPVRLDNLGKGYTEADIFERITAQRNGIRIAAPTELPKRRYKYNGSFQNRKPIKLKGFKALYFRYMYLFKIIRKKRTPQRVSFFMRDELIKFDRYKKQFRFIVANNIETGKDLQSLQSEKEERINELVSMRTQIYDERTDEDCEEVKEQAKEINKELNALRSDVRMCKAIFKDSYRISEKKRQAEELQRQADKELENSQQIRKNRRL